MTSPKLIASAVRKARARAAQPRPMLVCLPRGRRTPSARADFELAKAISTLDPFQPHNIDAAGC